MIYRNLGMEVMSFFLAFLSWFSLVNMMSRGQTGNDINFYVKWFLWNLAFLEFVQWIAIDYMLYCNMEKCNLSEIPSISFPKMYKENKYIWFIENRNSFTIFSLDYLRRSSNWIVQTILFIKCIEQSVIFFLK